MRHILRDEKGRFKKATPSVPSDLQTLLTTIDGALQHQYGAHSKAEAIGKVCVSYFENQAKREQIENQRKRDAELVQIANRGLDLISGFRKDGDRIGVNAVKSVVTAINDALKA
jgi:hypothetical protein